MATFKPITATQVNKLNAIFARMVPSPAGNYDLSTMTAPEAAMLIDSLTTKESK